MKKIRAFGQDVDRSDAYEFVIADWISNVCYAGNTDALKDLLFDGWKPLDEWSDEELEDYIEDLCPENQPGEGVSTALEPGLSCTLENLKEVM